MKNERQLARNLPIEIQIPNGKPVLDPFYARVGLGHDLKWSANPTDSWIISFRDKRTPLEGVFVVKGQGNVVEGGPHVVKHDGHFRYAIAVARMRDGGLPPEMFIDADCPEIIVY